MFYLLLLKKRAHTLADLFTCPQVLSGWNCPGGGVVKASSFVSSDNEILESNSARGKFQLLTVSRFTALSL